jgi:transcriptional regulator with XRE-family HTH domain
VHVALGATIRAVREEQGLSLTELAKAAETDKAYISGLERGQRNPSWAFIVRLAAALGVTPVELVSRTERLESDNR